MLQSLFILPVAVVVEVVIFLLLYLVTPIGSRTAGLLVALLTLAVLYGYSAVNWPGADVLAMYTAVLLVTAYLLVTIASVREKRRSQGGAPGSWFHWAPFTLIVFFLILFTVDSLYVFVSKDGLPQPIARWVLPDLSGDKTVRSAFPGTIQRNFQKKEALYNEYLDQVRQQKKQGWRINKGWLGRPVANQQAIFQVAVTDKRGEPVTGAAINGFYQRPADSRLDQAFEMRETDVGLYQANLVLPEPGQWDLVLYIQRGEQRHELHAKTSVDAAQK